MNNHVNKVLFKKMQTLILANINGFTVHVYESKIVPGDHYEKFGYILTRAVKLKEKQIIWNQIRQLCQDQNLSRFKFSVKTCT